MSNAPQCSINFLLAREAPVGVLLRRGPSKVFQCLLWNLETDEITPGQWLDGKVFAERCDLSPDGKLLVYFVSNYKKEESTWTAISRPPFFTALALWFKGPSYNGGGLFQANDRVRINGLPDHKYSDKFSQPKVKVGSFWVPVEHVEAHRMIRDGWRVARIVDGELHLSDPQKDYEHFVPRFLAKSVGGIEITETKSYRKSQEVRTYSASIRGAPVDVQGAHQVDIDLPRSRIVYTVKGKLLVSDGRTVTEIVDLSDRQFELMPPADWATRWP